MTCSIELPGFDFTKLAHNIVWWKNTIQFSGYIAEGCQTALRKFQNFINLEVNNFYRVFKNHLRATQCVVDLKANCEELIWAKTRFDPRSNDGMLAA